MSEPQNKLAAERNASCAIAAAREATEAGASDESLLKRRGDKSIQEFACRALVAACLSATVAIALLLLWYAVDVLLLIFAGVLLAAFLYNLSSWLTARTGIGAGWSLAIVTLLIVAALGACVWLLAPRISDQVDVLNEQLPRAVAQLTARLERYGWGRRIIASALARRVDARAWKRAGARATGVVSSTLGALTNIAIVVSIGLYLAATPRLYTNGVVRLVPLQHRPRAREVLEYLGDTCGIGSLAKRF